MTSLARIVEESEESHVAPEEPRDMLVISDPIAPHWSLADFDIGKKLGEGQFGAVFLARERRTRLIVALKAIKKAQLLSTFNEHLLRREIEIHSHLIHPNILGFYGWFVTNVHIVLILEIAPKGELMDTLIDGGLPESVVSRYMMQMISAIRCCHRLNVMHRDLKPENILVDFDGDLKLADFGWAAHVPDEESAKPAAPKAQASQNRGNPSFNYLKTRRKTYCGTLDYLSPEICRHEWYGKEVDLWCLGVLCYELATGRPPFSHDNYLTKGFTEEQARKLQQKDIQTSDIKLRLLPSMSGNLQDFLCKTLAKNPAQRINTSQMLNHAFITAYNDITQEVALEKLFQQEAATDQYAMPQSSHDLIVSTTLISSQPSSNSQNVATPGPASAMSPSCGGPKWQYSRYFLSAASSPNSGPVGSASHSPFPLIRGNQTDTSTASTMFAPALGAAGYTSSGFALFNASQN